MRDAAVEKSTVFSVLVVCTGNICRSPLAGALLRDRLGGHPSLAVEVLSAGTWADAGDRVPAQILERAEGLGLDLSEHRPLKLAAEHIRAADLVLGLALEHRREVVGLVPGASARTFTLREFARILDYLPAIGQMPPTDYRSAVDLVARASSNRGMAPAEDIADNDVVDPYRLSDEVYDEAVAAIASAVEAVCGRLLP